jgi:hypothetical protein
MQQSNIVFNPVFNKASKESKKPYWLCNHNNATVIDYENKKYKCACCNRDGNIIVKFSQSKLLSNLL